MLKLITLKLTSVKHSGDFIGDDIRVEINALDKFFSVDKKIKKNKSITYRESVGQFFADGKIFSPEIKITVVEKDFVYNDVGSLSAKLKIDLDGVAIQSNVYKIEVYEKRSAAGYSRKRAFFEITLEADIEVAVSYIPETNDGWLKTWDASGKVVSLPSYLKVRVDRRESGRDFFSILEGPLRGRDGSVKYQQNGSSFLVVENSQIAQKRAIYSVRDKIFVLDDKRYLCVDYPGATWEKGLYDIEIPDFPHPGGSNYVHVAPRAKVWFLVGHSGERYIHTGSRSAGCITLVENERWEEVWKILARARKGDGVSVGILEVID